MASLPLLSDLYPLLRNSVFSPALGVLIYLKNLIGFQLMASAIAMRTCPSLLWTHMAQLSWSPQPTARHVSYPPGPEKLPS